jgi:hypothetical protein
MSERIPADLHNTLTETKESLLLPPEEVQVSDFLGLRDESIREIYDALVNENTEQVNNFLENLSSSDKAELLEKANRETRKIINAWLCAILRCRCYFHSSRGRKDTCS